MPYFLKEIGKLNIHRLIDTSALSNAIQLAILPIIP